MIGPQREDKKDPSVAGGSPFLTHWRIIWIAASTSGGGLSRTRIKLEGWRVALVFFLFAPIFGLIFSRGD